MKTFPSPRRQQGAVLFVALMVLIMMSLLGVAAMQVTTMQERMAGNYRVDNMAFENAEGRTFQQHQRITTLLVPGLVDTIVTQFRVCAPLNVDTWAGTTTATAGVSDIQSMGTACGYTSLRRDLGVDDYVPYRVTSADFDSPSIRSARAAIQTVYIPIPPRS